MGLVLSEWALIWINDIMDMESVMDNKERGNKEKVLSRNR